MTDLGTPELDKPAEATPVVPAPETAQLDRLVEKRQKPAEPSGDHLQHVGSEPGHQSKGMKLSDKVRVGAGASMPDGFEDTDKLGRPGHSAYFPMMSSCADTCPESRCRWTR